MISITLRNLLPRVFAGETIPPSDIWKGEVTFRRGCFYLVEAASGGGKSSMCSYIYGARTDFEGSLLFDGVDASSIGIDGWLKIRRESLAYLPQELSLFPELTALQNIELKNALTNHVERGQIEEWLHELGIDSRRDYPVGRMSVGQRQRVGLIRSLCQPFDFLLLDEPVSHLDEANNEKAAALVATEARRQGAAVISTSVGNPLLLPDPIFLKL